VAQKVEENDNIKVRVLR